MIISRLSYFVVAILMLSLFSCEKAEEPVILPPKPEGVSLIEIPMGEQYDNQIFYNLQTGQSWAVDMNQWDLQFEASPQGHMVLMNGGREVLVANSGQLDFGPVQSSLLTWQWDRPTQHPDSIYLSRCFTHPSDYDSVYLVDRGPRVPPSERYFQIRFEHADEFSYTISIANESGLNPKRMQVPKDHRKCYVYFTYANGGMALNFEPEKHQWDICFQRYRWAFYEFAKPLLYTVVGVLSNKQKVMVAVDSSMVFEQITFEHTLHWPFHDRKDAIGFEWKWPDFTATGVKYSCRLNWNYIVKDRAPSGPVHKLRFIDFYNDQGLKGYPRFELQRLH